jgi:RNase H-like domain found in reverse transcriptase
MLRCQDAVGKTKTGLRSYGLSQLWGSDADRQFKDLRSVIVERVTLSHPDHGKAFWMHTDASQDYYAAVLTQMPQEDLEKNADEQRHEPLAFISGRFLKAMYNWSGPEKEAFAIMAAMTTQSLATQTLRVMLLQSYSVGVLSCLSLTMPSIVLTASSTISLI